MKISEMSEDEAKQHLYDCYMAHHNAIASGDAEGPHPSKDVSRWRAAAAGAPVEGEIQKGQDDVQPEKDAGSNAGNGGPVPAQDGRYTVGSDSVPRFETSDGRVLRGNDAIVARARQSNPSRAANIASRIKGFDRLK